VEGTQVERIAHRGAKLEFPENTLGAFRRAFERNADAVELDVHATKDGMVVVNHDPELGDTYGPLAGRLIAELEWADLAKASTSAATRAPTLSDVLGVTPAGATVYVEIKGSGIEEAVAAIITDARVRCAVHSFDHGAIARMRSLAPAIPRGILFDTQPLDVPGSMAETGARDVWPHWKLIDAELVKTVHAAGGRVIAWTVNDLAVASKLASLGVDGLCTDDVRLLDRL
jgi:glycerophosphoryl diester phosphodiesterase